MKNWIAMVMLIGFFLLPASTFSEPLNITTMVWPPMVVKDGNQLKGSGVEVAQEVCKRMGIEAKIRILPWARAISYMKNGKADALMAPKKTEERTKFMHFAEESLYVETLVVIARKGGMKAAGLGDLKDKKIAVVRGYSYGDKFDSFEGLRKIICNSDKELMKIFYKGRVELAVGEKGNLEWIRRDLGFKEPFETIYTLAKEPNFMAFSKKALGPKGEAMTEMFAKTLRQLKEEGKFQEIQSKYY